MVKSPKSFRKLDRAQLAGPPRGLGGQCAPVGHRERRCSSRSGSRPLLEGKFEALGQGALERGGSASSTTSERPGVHVNSDMQQAEHRATHCGIVPETDRSLGTPRSRTSDLGLRKMKTRSSSTTLNQGQLCSTPGDTGQCLETCWVVTAWGCSRHLTGKGQRRCLTSCSAQDSAHDKAQLFCKRQGAKVEVPERVGRHTAPSLP